VRFRVVTQGDSDVLRHLSGLPTISSRFADETLVLGQVRWAFLQVHRSSLRLKAEPDVVYVYSTNRTHGEKGKVTVSICREYGRLPDMPRQGRESS
jgi:hypothetical protein